LHMPLSSFDPAAVPRDPSKSVVVHCAGGRRSKTAVAQCQQAGLKIEMHLAGGLAACKSAVLPTLSAPRKPGLLPRLFGG